MKVIYLAHPCGAKSKAAHLENLARAKRWFLWVINKGYAVIADWIIYCEVWDDFDPLERAAGLKHDDAMIQRCDEYWMVGGEVTSGMRRGSLQATTRSIPVVNLTYLGSEPPE